VTFLARRLNSGIPYQTSPSGGNYPFLLASAWFGVVRAHHIDQEDLGLDIVATVLANLWGRASYWVDEYVGKQQAQGEPLTARYESRKHVDGNDSGVE